MNYYSPNGTARQALAAGSAGSRKDAPRCRKGCGSIADGMAVGGEEAHHGAWSNLGGSTQGDRTSDCLIVPA